MQKVAVLFGGPLRQEFPKIIPARQYMSLAKANALNLPYSTREGPKKFEKLQSEILQNWNPNSKSHFEQMKICKQLLEIGNYKQKSSHYSLHYL